MRISCSLTFYVNFKPLIIKIGWELDILCYIFWNSKIWRATFALFLVFLFYFSVSFYPIWMKIISKFRENVGLHAYCLGLVLNQSWTSLRTAVFSGLSQKIWEDWVRWSAWTGYSPVRFSVPFWSYELDLFFFLRWFIVREGRALLSTLHVVSCTLIEAPNAFASSLQYLSLAHPEARPECSLP